MTTPEAPDPRKVAEAALDVFVYAPMGLALEAKELLPKLAERGRNQVVLARLGARFAMQRAEAEVDKLIERLQPHDDEPAVAPAEAPIPTAATEPAGTATATTTPAASPPAPAARKRATSTGRTTATRAARKPAAPKPAARKPATRTPAATTTAEPKASEALAIPGYDTLSASQVVPRLDALRAAELEAIRRYEAANRGRRTILSRIAQLQG